MPALMYTASIAKAPFKTVKGPDVLNLDVSISNGEVQLTGKASDSEMVNSIVGKDFSDFKTGDQDISEVRVYLDAHPDDATSSDTSWLMEPSRRRLVDTKEEGYTPKRTRTVAAVDCSSYTEKKKCKRHGAVLQADGTWLGVSQICEWYTTDDICGISSFITETETGATTTSLTDGSINIVEGQSSSSIATSTVLVTTSKTTTTATPATTEASTTTTEATTTASPTTNAVPEFTSGDENVQITIDTNNLTSGRHTLYVQAIDSDGYKGPVSSVFIDVSRRKLRGSN